MTRMVKSLAQPAPNRKDACNGAKENWTRRRSSYVRRNANGIKSLDNIMGSLLKMTWSSRPTELPDMMCEDVNTKIGP